jgi:CheY-like chemotaxis protein
MSRILLVDDSPHAQRIGERILVDEGFEVVTVSNSDSALIRLDDADPDVLVAKAHMPGRSGYEICQFVKMSPRHRHMRVILTAGVTETLDPAEVERSHADGTLKKPFEASVLIGAVRPLAEAAKQDRGASGLPERPTAPKLEPKLIAPMIAVIDPEQVRAAVTVALDAAMPVMIDAITQRVLNALTARRPAEKLESRPAPPALAAAAAAPPIAPNPEAARPVTRVGGSFSSAARALRPRSGSILGLGLDLNAPAAPPDPDKPPQS